MDSFASEPPQVDPFISTLHDLITVCTDITETSPSMLTSKPGIGGELVRKVQEVGRAWDEHPDWYGRTWYITVLLAVATLARVVEWFEAERQFWRFEEEEGEDGEVEPLTFVLKPEFDGDGYMSGRERDESVPKTPIAATSGDENPLRLSRSGDEGGRMSRDERVPQKDLRGGILVGDQGTTPGLGVPSTSGGRTPPQLAQQDASTQRPLSRNFGEVSAQQGPSRPQEVQRKVSDQGKAQGEPTLPPEALRMEASEHLRQKADKAKSSNILMELNLDGEHFLYINRTWLDVIGYVKSYGCLI
jgi:serine/threonine-protein kinase RIM15